VVALTITLASKSGEAQDAFVAELATHFKLQDLGPTSFLLGIEIIRDRPKRRLYLSQHQYIVNKLAEFEMTDCKPVGTPMTPGLQLSKEDSPKTQEEVEAMRNILLWNSFLFLILFINHASSILSNELSNTSVWMLWNSSLFNILYFIIVWSCGHHYKV